MAAADSVITKVACDLLNGTVLVGQLELIWRHRGQFLDIWELSEFRAEGGGNCARGSVEGGLCPLYVEGLFLL